MSSRTVAPVVSASPAARSRCVLVLLGGTAVAGGMTAVLTRLLHDSLPAAATDSGVAAAARAAVLTGTAAEVLVRLCLLTLLVAVALAWLQACAAVAEAWRGASGSGRRSTGVVRRLALAACGVTLVGLLTTVPAQADPGPGRDPVAGLPLPDRATDRVTERGAAAASPREPTRVVRAGDTLWALAAERLAPGAADADIDAAWQQIYRANRRLVGDDPDVIVPGQRLALPHSPADRPTR